MSKGMAMVDQGHEVMSRCSPGVPGCSHFERRRKFYGMASFWTKFGFVHLQDLVSMLARP